MARPLQVEFEEARGDGFGYDLSSQITSIRQNGNVSQNGTVTGGTLSTLTFDANGNRTNMTVDGASTNYLSNGLNQYYSISGVPQPTYDGNGNLTAYNDWTYSYDAMNRLIRAEGPGGAYAYFYYDGLNRQVARYINGVPQFEVWDGWDLFAEYASNANVRRH